MNINIQNVNLSLSIEDANVLLRELQPVLSEKTPLLTKLSELLNSTLEAEFISEKNTKYKVVAVG